MEKKGDSDFLRNTGKDFYAACETVIDIISLISKSPLKNIALGCGTESTFRDTLKRILDVIHKKVELTDYDFHFKLFHKLSLFKEFARLLWHGSLIGSLIEGNSELRNLIDVGKSITTSLGLEESLWEDFAITLKDL
jgi:hypothetical protein